MTVRAPALLLLVVLGAALALPAAAQVYKWTDKDGKVHFGDLPPPEATDVKALAIHSEPTDPRQLEALDVQRDLREKQSSMETDLRANQAKRAAEEAENKQAACDAARKRYENLQHSRKFSTVGADGKETWMSGDDAYKMRDELKATVDKACAGLK